MSAPTFWMTALAAGVGFFVTSLVVASLSSVLKLIVKGMDAADKEKP